jgi:hypothetical protein
VARAARRGSGVALREALAARVEEPARVVAAAPWAPVGGAARAAPQGRPWVARVVPVAGAARAVPRGRPWVARVVPVAGAARAVPRGRPLVVRSARVVAAAPRDWPGTAAPSGSLGGAARTAEPVARVGRYPAVPSRARAARCACSTLAWMPRLATWSLPTADVRAGQPLTRAAASPFLVNPAARVPRARLTAPRDRRPAATR